MSETKIELGPEQAMSYLEAQVNQAIYDLETNLLPALGHSEAKRLISAIVRYPTLEADFSADKVEMIKAYSAMKICFDANVALGLEIIEQAKKEQEEAQKEENNG